MGLSTYAVRSTIRRIVLLAAGMILLLGAATTAHAVGAAVFSAPTPAAGSTIAKKPSWISVKADDTRSVIGATMLLNGLPVPATIEYPSGHFVWDDEQESDVWVNDDPTLVRLMFYNCQTRILNGSNAVTATVTSANGTTSYSWTFSYGTGGTIGTVSPAAGSVLPSSPASITAAVVSPYASFTATMLLDGASVPVTFASGTKTFTYTPGSQLAPGTHTVAFSARDAAATTASKSWTFTVRPPMSTGGDCVSCHVTYPSAHPTDVCSDCHAHGYTVAGGSHGAATPTAAGCGGDGTQQASACHRLDHTSDSGWGIWGSGPFVCSTCHSAAYPAVAQHTDARTTTAHESGATGCGPCHSGSLISEHAKFPKANAIKYQCDLCHGANAPQKAKDAIAAGTTTCTACHAGAADHESQHVATVDAACAGAGCHTAVNLLGLHGATGCAGCHEATSPNVITAISIGDRSCAACHKTSGTDYHKNMAVHYAPDSAASCGHCHHLWGANATRGPDVTQHNAGCTTCHDGIRDLSSITTKCTNCHAQDGTDFHVNTVTWHSATDAGSLSCARCHESANVKVLHASVGCNTCHKTYACGECHAPHSPIPNTPLLTGVACSRCHTTVGTNYHRSFEATHTFSAMPVSCQASGCHVNKLTDAHASLVGAGGRYPQYADTCALCHLNDSPTRVPATATSDCSSCHAGADHENVDHSVAGPCIASGCHVGNGVTIHQAGPKCQACHAPGVTPTLVCRTCHPTPHTAANHGSADICSSCHSTGNLMTVHADKCTTCHATPANGMTWNGTCSQVGCHPNYHSTMAMPQGGNHPSDHGYGDYCWDCHPGDEPSEWNCNGCHTSAERSAPITTSDARSSYTGLALIRLFPVDQPTPGWATGVKATYYQVDGGALQTGVTIVIEGPASGVETHTVEFWSSDVSFNSEAHHIVNLRIVAGGPDTNPPAGTMSINAGATWTYTPVVTVNSAVADSENGIAAMRIDPGTGVFGAWGDYYPTSAITMPATNGVKTVRAEYKDAGGNVLALSDTIALDSVTPAGTMSINGGASSTNTLTVTINSSVTDSYSGLTEMRLLDNSNWTWGPWEPYSPTKVRILGAGTFVSRNVYAQYRDAAGNVLQLVDNISYINDLVAPTGTMTVSNNATYTTSTAVTLNSAVTDTGGSALSQMRVDPGSGTFGAWIGYAATYSFTLASGDGVKTVRAEYRDGSGNVLARSDTITLDTVAPAGSMSVENGAASTSVTSVNVNSAIVDSASGMGQMRVDPGTGVYGAWVNYTATYLITLPAGDGVKTVNVQYRDNAGLVATRADTITLTTGADAVPPTGSITVGGGASFVGTTTVALGLSAVDTGGSGLSQMRFSNDDSSWSAWETYATSKNWIVAAGDGPKTVYVQYRDTTGNVSTTYSDGITLDVTAPTGTVLINGNAAYTTTTAAALAFSASDGSGSGLTQMRVSNDNSTWSAWETYATSKSWTLTEGEGTKTVYVQFRDALGNVSGSVNDGIALSTAGTATLAFEWNGYGYAELHVENSEGVTIASTTVSGGGSELSWYVPVPAGQVYHMVCDYYEDWDYDSTGGGYGIYTDDTSINADGVLSPNETVYWQY